MEQVLTKFWLSFPKALKELSQDIFVLYKGQCSSNISHYNSCLHPELVKSQ